MGVYLPWQQFGIHASRAMHDLRRCVSLKPIGPHLAPTDDGALA